MGRQKKVGGARKKPSNSGSSPAAATNSNSGDVHINSSSHSRHHQPHLQLQQQQVQDAAARAERARMREFWLSLSDSRRCDLVKLDKSVVLGKIKEQQDHRCTCTVCGRRRTVIEEELEVLYDAYYEELEEHERARIKQSERGPGGAVPFSFARSLTAKNGVLTVVDELLKDRGQKFLELLDMSDRRGHNDFDPVYAADLLRSGDMRKPSLSSRSNAADRIAGSDSPLTDRDADAKGGKGTRTFSDLYDPSDAIDDPYDPYGGTDDPYGGNEDPYSEREASFSELSEEERLEEGRRMFQMFAAKLFEHRILAAYREFVAQQTQASLIAEEELDRAKREKNAAKRARQKEQQREQRAQELERQRQLDAQRKAEAEEAERKKQQQLEEAQRKRQEAMRLKHQQEEAALQKRLAEVRRLEQERLEKERAAAAATAASAATAAATAAATPNEPEVAVDADDSDAEDDSSDPAKKKRNRRKQRRKKAGQEPEAPPSSSSSEMVHLQIIREQEELRREAEQAKRAATIRATMPAAASKPVAAPVVATPVPTARGSIGPGVPGTGPIVLLSKGTPLNNSQPSRATIPQNGGSTFKSLGHIVEDEDDISDLLDKLTPDIFDAESTSCNRCGLGLEPKNCRPPAVRIRPCGCALCAYCSTSLNPLGLGGAGPVVDCPLCQTKISEMDTLQPLSHGLAHVKSPGSSSDLWGETPAGASSRNAHTVQAGADLWGSASSSTTSVTPLGLGVSEDLWRSTGSDTAPTSTDLWGSGLSSVSGGKSDLWGSGGDDSLWDSFRPPQNPNQVAPTDANPFPRTGSIGGGSNAFEASTAGYLRAQDLSSTAPYLEASFQNSSLNSSLGGYDDDILFDPLATASFGADGAGSSRKVYDPEEDLWAS